MTGSPTSPGAMSPPACPDGRTARRIALIWTLLMINVLGGLDGNQLVSIPKAIGQTITMGSLAVAFVLALQLNPMVRVRPNTFLVPLSVLVVLAFVSSSRLESGLGALVRCGRLAVFVATLWLLSEWWRGDLRFARLHVHVLGGVLASVLAGLFVSPKLAFAGAEGGRLTGVLWPIPPTQVGEYGAVAAGLAILLWLYERLDGHRAATIAAPALACLLLSHTRTAIVGFLVGLSVPSLSLLFRNSRARRVIGLVAALAAVAALAFPDLFVDWYQRDQSDAEVASLTGRQTVWDAILAHGRTAADELIGVGLTDKSFNGLPIDSTWLATYHELGDAGVALVAALLIGLLITAAARPPTPARGCAIFLVLYCAVASYTEVGLGDSSPYLLHLAVATSLLALPKPLDHGSG